MIGYTGIKDSFHFVTTISIAIDLYFRNFRPLKQFSEFPVLNTTQIFLLNSKHAVAEIQG